MRHDDHFTPLRSEPLLEATEAREILEKVERDINRQDDPVVVLFMTIMHRLARTVLDRERQP